MAKVSLIAALSKYDRAIGKDGSLPWRLPPDMQRFKRLTMGHPVIMGRKTFESIGKPLPGRDNIIITRNLDYQAPGATVLGSVEEALQKAKNIDRDEVFVIGGGEIYALALPYADKLYLTLVDKEVPGADAFFPEYERFNKKTFQEEGQFEDIGFEFIDLERD